MYRSVGFNWTHTQSSVWCPVRLAYSSIGKLSHNLVYCSPCKVYQDIIFSSVNFVCCKRLPHLVEKKWCMLTSVISRNYINQAINTYTLLAMHRAIGIYIEYLICTVAVQCQCANCSTPIKPGLIADKKSKSLSPSWIQTQYLLLVLYPCMCNYM